MPAVAAEEGVAASIIVGQLAAEELARHDVGAVTLG